MNPKAYELISGFNANMAAAADRLNKLAKHFPKHTDRLERDALRIQAECAGALKFLLADAASAAEDDEIRLTHPPVERGGHSEVQHPDEENSRKLPHVSHDNPTANIFEPAATAGPENVSMGLEDYYRALSQFCSGATQMHSALQVFTSLERFRGREHNAFNEYQIDLELLRSSISDIVIDNLRESEFHAMQDARRAKKVFVQERAETD